MKGKIHEKIKYFLPLLFALIAIISLLGVDLIYEIEVNDVKTKYSVHLWDLFNPDITPIWIIIVIISFIALGALLPLLYLYPKLKNNENIAVISAFASLIAVLFLFAEKDIFAYFGSSLIPEFKKAKFAYGLGFSILLSLCSSFFALSCSNKKYGNNIKAICEDGLLIAFAFVLNMFKIPIGATGGSFNFQMLPLFVIALRRGPLHGLIAGGLIYGILTCATDGYGFATYPFDYFIGFGSIAIFGLFRNIIFGENTSFIKGELFILLAGTISTLIRFIGSCVSSMLIYGYGFVAALAYNAIYIPLSGLFAVIAIMLLYQPLKTINKRYPVKSEEVATNN